VTPDLVTWLREQLDAEKAAATAADVLYLASGDGLWGDDAAHASYWNPSRVLAEIKAKRAILDRAFDEAAIVDGEKGCCHPAEEIRDGKCPAHRAITYLDFPLLFILAQPYRDRPGFHEGWAL
jgi:hypothetical protein